MAKAKQITVTLENHAGALARLAETLGAARVNILAMYATTSGAEGHVHMVVDTPAKALKALAAAGLPYTEKDVLTIEVPNKTGALAKYAAKLAGKNVNINSAYATSAKGGKKALMVVAVADLAQAMRVK